MTNDPAPYSAVIFDLDGTLLDTLADISHAANRVLSDQGLPVHAIESYRQFVGEGVRVLFRQALPERLRSEDRVAQCAAAFQRAYAEQWHVHTRSYDGIRELLAELVRRDVQLSVLSNKPHRFTRLCIERFLPQTPFRHIFGQREGVPRKPDPAAAIDMGRNSGVPAEQIVYVGDTAIDMQTARAAGMYAVGVTWGFRPAAELQATGACRLIDHPLELLELWDEPLAARGDFQTDDH